MKFVSTLAALFAALILAGCRETVIVNGKPCAMLTETELQEMQSIALATLAHNLDKKNVVEPSEYAQAMQTPPQCRIRYYSDLIGRAEYTWDFPARKTTVIIQGEFLNPKQRLVFVTIQPKHPAVIDTTHKLPKNAPIFQEERKKK